MEDGAKKRGCSERNISRKRKRFEEHVASLADNNAELCTCELCSESEGSTFYKKRRKKQESDSDSDSAEGCDDIIQEENESDSDSDSAEGYNDLIQEENESDSDSDNAEGCDDPTEGENDHGEVNLNEGNGNSEPEPSEPSSPENSDSGSDDEDNFDLNDELLNQRLELAGNSTVRDALAVLLSVTVRFKLPLVALEALLKGHNTLLGYRALPHDKRKLWKVLKRNSSGIVKYAYCPHTTASLGLYDALPDHVVCEHCEKTHRKREVKYFVTFSLRKQLEKFLNLPGTSEILNYSNIRVKNSDDCYEDIYDGHKYCELREEGGPLHSPYSFSYNINTDGVSLSESSQTEAWPLYIRLNECKPTLRQKCVFIAALWVDKKKPNFNLFLKNFVDEGNDLLENGIQWTPPGAVEEVTSIFCPACLVVDAKARAPCLNMKDVTGHYGCTFCTHVGVSRGRGPVKFPVRPNPPEYDFEEPVLRSDDSIRNGMMTAQPVRDGDVLGVKGPSQLMRLLNFDLFVNQVTDDLHPWFEGVAKFHTELMLQRRKPWSIPSDELPTVNRRIHLSVTPTTLSRKPRDLSVSNQWTGTEWRNWLINYSIPCLQGTIPRRYLQHWSLLANAAYLLHKSSISEEDLNTAERCIRSYSETFEDYFGVDNMRYNLHVLIHSVISVRNWGPMWAHSTFPFESMNSKVLNSIFSPKDPINQVLLRLQMVSLVNTIPFAGNISEEVRQLVGSLSDKTRKIVTTVNGAHFLGSGTRRLPTNAELELLRRRNIECDHITEYYRVLHNGIEFRSPLYNPDAKSNNTCLYTHDDRFCCIESIVLINDVQGGMFVRLFDLVENAINAGYIAKVQESDTVIFIQLTNAQALCVQVKVRNALYLSPVPNHFEID